MSEELGLSVKKFEDFDNWYLEVIKKAEVIDTRYGIKGFQIYMPLGMSIVKEMTRLFEHVLDRDGHKPVLFPVIIPESNLKKESEHIKGFEREVFWITHAGKNKLEEKACLRPTSETAMYPIYSLWIRSYTQLPLKLYQSVCVYRYETKMTRPLMRPREFVWIEAHTAQKNREDSIRQVEEDMKNFKEVVNDKLRIPFLLLKRPQWDKFPGAVDTYAFETILPDGISLQIGTTHHLGENFAKVFKIKYMDASKKNIYVDQTCFGIGISRILGAMVSIHGDDKGLILPPVVAPIQIVIIPIFTKDTKAKVLEKCGEISGKLKERFRAHLDDREQYTPGFKFNEWELKGVPLRVEIGPIDIENNKISIVRRDSNERSNINEDKLEEFIIENLDDIGSKLYKRANELMLIKDVKYYGELKKNLKEGGFVRIPFCMKEECAKKLKEETGAEVRGTVFGKTEKVEGKCAICGDKALDMAYVAEAY